MIRIALVGQPNCGKSTIFNHLVGYKANTSNLPGTTVEYLASEAFVDGRHVEIVDLPGLYSLTSSDEAEVESRNFLMNEGVDAILNVVDASLLSRSLELTLQLLELGLPTVVCLNMADEARRKGIRIDSESLAAALGVPVVEATAIRGLGVKQAVSRAVVAARKSEVASPPRYGADVEGAIAQLAKTIPSNGLSASLRRLTAIKLLEEDPFFKSTALPAVRQQAAELSTELATLHGHSASTIVAAERHHLAMSLFERNASVGAPVIGLRDRVDAVLMHPVLGLILLGGILYGLFLLVFGVGARIEAPILGLFEQTVTWLETAVGAQSIWFFVLRGLIQGIGGAIGLVLPYLVPFLAGLAILEDIGYLPRAGFLADGLMHRIGLHGKSVIPFILGYGCSVPAVMATRILDSKRDRFVTSMLSVMIPCVARTTIIYGLIGYFVGPHWAFLLYVLNIVVIAVVGKILTKLLRRVTPGLILEIPSYKVPSPRVVIAKVWLQIKNFFVMAFPVLVIGSLAISLLEFAQWDVWINRGLLPVTWSLGLPLTVGVPLIFGVFRKELSLVMLFQALGTSNVPEVMSVTQMLVFTVFTLFYVPCVATVAVLWRELGRWQAAAVVGSTTGIALVVGLLVRGVAALF